MIELYTQADRGLSIAFDLMNGWMSYMSKSVDLAKAQAIEVERIAKRVTES